MKVGILLKWVLIIVGSITIAFSTIIILINIGQAKQDSIYFKPVEPKIIIIDVNKPNIELPISIKTPQIGVDTSVYIKPVEPKIIIIDVNKPNIELPISIKTPQIGVDTAVEYLGITPNLIDAQSQSNVSSEQTNSNLPVRLKIPTIKVDAAVEYLGVTPEGAMDVPKGPDNVGWFDLGPRPGEIGSAVVAGHEGWKNNIPAVFDNLYKLKIGDKVYVIDDNGVTTTFVVSKIRIYDQNEDATNVFSSNDGLIHLNLITCEGIWDAAKKGRPNRLVVFTDKE